MKHRPLIYVVLILALVMTPLLCSGSEFRGKWWHYYERGISTAERGESEKASSDLKRSIGMRDKDQRMARTYGMHFIDYFPHRELGIVYLAMGKHEQAIAELEESIRGEESAKAMHFLNKARKETLLRQAVQIAPPVITITSPIQDTAVKETRLRVKGKVTGNGYISRIAINNRSLGFDLAQRGIEFEQEISVDEADSRIVVTAEDLLGNIVVKSVTVRVDTEGPLIAIFDVAPREKGGKRYVRVTGEVTDATGIRSIAINDRTVEVRDARTFALDIEEERGRSDRLIIRARDSLDNMTEAEFDLERDLAAFSRKLEPVLVASAIPRIFSSDRENPVITLKESGDLAQVFVDKYYVDGEISDNDRVDRIVINDRELQVKKGRKVFFGRLVKLNKGKNRVSLAAYDASGNKAVSEFSITRKIPAVMENGSRMSLSVLPFTGKVNADYAQLADDFLIGSLVEQKRFMVIERERLKQVLAEQKLSKEKLTDPEHSVRLGKLIAADAIVVVSVREEKKSMEIVARVINTETSEVMAVKDVFTEDKGRAAAKELMDGLAAKLARGFPLAEGMVVKAAGSDIYTDLGSASIIHKGTGVIIYKKGPEIRHPVTGKSLGSDTVKLAEGRIEEVRQGFSKVRLLDKYKKQGIKAADLVILK